MSFFVLLLLLLFLLLQSSSSVTTIITPTVYALLVNIKRDSSYNTIQENIVRRALLMRAYSPMVCADNCLGF